MKHYFKTIATAVLAVLAVAACQKENLGEVAPDGREVEVKLTLTSPQIGTKSYADGKTVNKVFVHVYQQDAAGNLKYIAPATPGKSATPSQVVDMTGGAAKYSTRLVTGQKYTFVFWAEYRDAASPSPYTYDPETKTVTVNYTAVAGNDETRDAFCNVLKDVEITGAYSSEVKLYRPFAQLNFGVTSEDYAAAKAAGLEVTAAKVKLTKAATTLSLLDGNVSGAAEVTFAAAALPTETLSAAGATYKYVAMDYVLVGKAAKTLSDVTLTLTATGTHPEFTYSNVPLQGNYRTNIVGNLFTSPAEVNITVDPAFDAPAHNVYPELLAVAANGGSITLSEDVELSEPLVIAAGKDAVINLNGKTINFKGGKDDAHCFAFRVKGSLTIEGSGTIDGGDDVHTERIIVWANGADAKVTIKGGIFKMGKNTNGIKSWYDCIYANDGAKVEIYDGTFQNDCEGRPQSLNIQNSGNKASILVYGGKFVNYDPSTGDDSLGGNFVADGYASVAASASPLTYEVEKCTAEVESCSDLYNLWADDKLKASYVLNIDNDMTIDKYLSPMNKTIKMTLSKNAKMVANEKRASVMTICYGSTLDLSGYGTFTGPSNKTSGNLNTAAIKTEKGNLNIYGSLKFEGGSGNITNNAVYVYSGTTNIYSGYFHAGLDKNGKANACILVDAWTSAASHMEAYCNIYGGVFEAEDPKYLLNIQDDVREYCSLLVYGGTFVGFNPADNTAEGEHTNFVADGYKSVETTYNGKKAWEVVPE